MNDDLENKIQEALQDPQNLGEMADADAVGTVGSENCGDMLRMWVKFKEEDGRKTIDRATFQTFGCQTAIAVASVATQMIRGMTPEEAVALSGTELAASLGELPPMKIHCAQLVEGALKNALTGTASAPSGAEDAGAAPTLLEQIHAPRSVNIKLLDTQ